MRRGCHADEPEVLSSWAGDTLQLKSVPLSLWLPLQVEGRGCGPSSGSEVGSTL